MAFKSFHRRLLLRGHHALQPPHIGPYPNPQTTPQNPKCTSPPQETITVIDPRQPLYERTLPLIHITNTPGKAPECIVWLQPGIERHIPLAATDRTPEPLTFFPLPLNLETVPQLLAIYERIQQQLAEGTADAGAKGSSSPSVPPRNGGREPGPEPGTQPAEVWLALSPAEQQQIYRQIVIICRSLVRPATPGVRSEEVGYDKV